MRFGLRLVCYLGGLALLVPASWRLGVAMASASSDPLARMHTSTSYDDTA